MKKVLTVLIVRPKVAELSMCLLGRSIHPELFDVCAHRRVEREEYSLDVNINSDGHLLVFRHRGLIMSEVGAESSHPLPERRMLMQHSIKSTPQKDQLQFRDVIAYQCEFQHDVVASSTILAINQEIPGIDDEALVHRFQSNGRVGLAAVSYVDVQSFQHHVQIRSFHTFPETCSIVRCRSVFRIKTR